MKAAIYNPYLDTLGGGERYTMAFAKVLADSGWKVEVEWKDIDIKNQLETRFGLDFKNIDIVQDVKRGDGYDLCFWVSDGSIPILRARKNILHFQVPFHHIGGNNLLNKMKLIRVDKIVCNSEFTKKIIDHEYGVESIVVYPPVDTEHIKPKRKENIILSVSRFSTLKQSKGHDILIEAFKKMVDMGLTNWKLVLAGGTEVGVGDSIEELETMATGYPIEIIKSPNFKTIKELFGKSKIFWSAAGYGVDEETNPEMVEHFGISIVEAMSAGAVPLAQNAGGPKEIIKDGINGFLWNTVDDLIKITNDLIGDNGNLLKISRQSKEDSKFFSIDQFQNKILSDIL